MYLNTSFRYYGLVWFGPDTLKTIQSPLTTRHAVYLDGLLLLLYKRFLPFILLSVISQVSSNFQQWIFSIAGNDAIIDIYLSLLVLDHLNIAIFPSSRSSKQCLGRAFTRLV